MRTKQWELTLIAFTDDKGPFYKVTRRLPLFLIAETKFFRSKDEAIHQFQEWLQ